MKAAADFTVVLAYWKLMDGAADGSFLSSVGYRILAAAIRGAYRKAAKARPSFAAAAERELKALNALEREDCASIDATADHFARILCAAAEGTGDDSRERILRELLYHLGRIVYVLDAADDLADDTRSGAYNPLRFRFAPQDGKLSPEDEQELRLSLQHSHNSIVSAFELLEQTPYTDILTNILYFGLPAVTRAVFAGTWKASQRQRKERSLHL